MLILMHAALLLAMSGQTWDANLDEPGLRSGTQRPDASREGVRYLRPIVQMPIITNSRDMLDT